MPDILKRRHFIETGDRVLIPDVEEPPPPEPKKPVEEDGVFREIALGEETEEAEAEAAETEAASEAEPEPAPEPEPPTREELAALFQTEVEELCQSEARRAYADAIAQKKGELRECMARVDERLAQMQEMQSQFMGRFAEELKLLAVDIAEKLILARIAEDDFVLQRLVMQTVSGVKNTNWLDVELSEELVNLVEFMKRELEKPEYHGRAAVTSSATPLDTVRVSSEEGTVVATVSAQAKNLREVFRKA